MTLKKDLQTALLEIIKASTIGDQQELLEQMRAKGFSLTQPTLSRYLKKLDITKESGFYQLKTKALEMPQQAVQILKLTVAQPSFIILHTQPGQATFVAFQIDQYVDYPQSERIMHETSLYSDAIAGTIAGYDTVMVIAKSPEMLPQVEEKLKDIFLL